MKKLHEVQAACAATKSLSKDRISLVFAEMDAERAYHAALRAEKIPRVNCAHCKRRFKPGEPMFCQWRYGRFKQLCLPCQRSKQDEHTDRPERQQPCATCAQTMYFDIHSWLHARRPQACSYQCNYRRKLSHHLERKRVEHATVACAVCGEMFTQARRDALTCSNRCRQALHRQRAADREAAKP